jgi:hypothetical protein
MKTTAIFYSHILQGHEATEKNAIEHANGYDFTQEEAKENSFPFLNYINTINGIEIYYNYGSDCFYFAQP